MTKYRVTATDGLNVRTIPTPIGNDPIGALPFGSIVDVIGTTTSPQIPESLAIDKPYECQDHNNCQKKITDSLEKTKTK
jgi:hypothetical protein